MSGALPGAGVEGSRLKGWHGTCVGCPVLGSWWGWGGVQHIAWQQKAHHETCSHTACWHFLCDLCCFVCAL